MLWPPFHASSVDGLNVSFIILEPHDTPYIASKLRSRSIAHIRLPILRPSLRNVAHAACFRPRSDEMDRYIFSVNQKEAIAKASSRLQEQYFNASTVYNPTSEGEATRRNAISPPIAYRWISHTSSYDLGSQASTKVGTFEERS